MDAIFKRTSVRKFTDEAVSDEQVEQLMRAGMAAPSAGNQQPWEFYVTRDAGTLERLSECSKYATPMAGAALGIVVCARADGARFPVCIPQDLSAATENILLEATELGLGSVWMGIAPEPDRMSAVASVIGLPEGLEAFSMIAVGHPASEQEPRGPKNYEPERVHWV